MKGDLSQYFEGEGERKQIGTLIEWLMLEKGLSRGDAARELHGQFGLSFGSLKGYFVNVFSGHLYGTSSERSIKLNPDPKRQRLAILLSWLGVAPEHEVVAAITTLDPDFHYTPEAYAPAKNAAAQPKVPDVNLETRVDTAPVASSSVPLPPQIKAVKSPEESPVKPVLTPDGRKVYGSEKGTGIHYKAFDKISHAEFGK